MNKQCCPLHTLILLPVTERERSVQLSEHMVAALFGIQQGVEWEVLVMLG